MWFLNFSKNIFSMGLDENNSNLILYFVVGKVEWNEIYEKNKINGSFIFWLIIDLMKIDKFLLHDGKNLSCNSSGTFISGIIFFFIKIKKKISLNPGKSKINILFSHFQKSYDCSIFKNCLLSRIELNKQFVYFGIYKCRERKI